MSEPNEIEVRNDNTEISISLNKKTFASFVLDFLGKKEKLSFSDEIDFVLRHNDIEQFYYLVNEKIVREQNTSIEHFLVTVSYNDNTSREISGIKALNEFMETRHVFPESVTLTWNIIVKFPNSPTIENQRISLTFLIDDPIEKRIREIYEEESGRSGSVILSIHHTNQSWAIEILNLIKDKIKNVSIVRPKVARYAKGFLRYFGRSGLLLMFMVPMILWMYFIPLNVRLEGKSDHYYKLAETIAVTGVNQDSILALLAVGKMESANIDNTANKLIHDTRVKDSLLKVGDDERKVESRRYRLIFSLSAYFVSIFIVWFYLKKLVGFYRSGSCILITKKAEMMHEAELSGKNKLEFYSLTFISVSLVLSIISNFVYQMIIS